MMNFVMQQVLTACYHRSVLCAVFLYLVYCAIYWYQMVLGNGMCNPQKTYWLTFERLIFALARYIKITPGN